MTSKQWAEISIAFDTPLGERTERQRDMTRSGLCYAEWLTSRRKDCEFLKALIRFCGKRVLNLGDRQWLARAGEGDTLRTSLAALFAAMNQAERREVLGGDF